MEECSDDLLEQQEIGQSVDFGSDTSSGMTSAQLEEARAIGRRELAASLLGRGIDLAYLVFCVLWIAHPDSWYVRWLETVSPSASIQLIFVALLLLVGNFLVALPLSFYAGHLLQHQYNLSKQTFGQWLWRKVKSLFVELVFGLVLVLALYWIIWMTHGWWWLVAALGFFLLSIVLGQLAPVLILPFFYKVDRLDEAEGQGANLNQIFRGLTSGTGL